MGGREVNYEEMSSLKEQKWFEGGGVAKVCVGPRCHIVRI